MQAGRFSFVVVNIFALADFHHELNLETLPMLFDIVDLQKSAPNSWLVRVRSSAALLKVFRSGKVRVTGGRSKADVRTALFALSDALQKAGLEVEDPSFEIRNLVAVVDVGRKVDLAAFARENAEVAVYEPEQFPGAIVSLSPGTALVFASGKAVSTGVATTETLSQAVSNLRSLW